MPNKKSSKKDAISSLKRNARNRAYKSMVRSFLVKFLSEKSVGSFNDLQKKYQSVARKGIISSAKAVRTISRCHKLLKQATGQSV